MNNKTRIIVIWLLTGAVLVAAMVIIGGITRLTQSGLSMVDWKLFMGMIPPMNEAQWIDTFANYQQYPEYQLINSTMTLDEFKGIFFWEWLHRFIGRVIGLVFFFPFVYFTIKGWVKGKLIWQLLGLFILGGFQGFLGWFMVKSGLVDMPHVSHYRLAIHLVAALTTYVYIIWITFQLVYAKKTGQPNKNLHKWNLWLLLVLFIQIVYGAFVAGLKAGLIYPTYPKMGDHWIAPIIGQSLQDEGVISLTNLGASVQFIHRIIAIIVVVFVLIIWQKSKQHTITRKQKLAVNYLLIAVTVQFLLGVFTLLYQVPVILGVTHQFGALILLTSVIYSVYWFGRKPIT